MVDHRFKRYHDHDLDCACGCNGSAARPQQATTCPACGSTEHDGWTDHENCPEDWTIYSKFEVRRRWQLQAELANRILYDDEFCHDPRVYALKQTRQDGSKWIQEFDTPEDAVSFRSHSGGVLVRRERIEGQPGLWWVEVNDDPSFT